MKGKVELSKVGYVQLKMGHMFLMAKSIITNVWWYKPSPIITHLWYFTICFPIWKLPSRKSPIFGDINHPHKGESHEKSHRIRAFGAAWICLPKRAARPLANWFWCSSLEREKWQMSRPKLNEALGGFTHDFPWLQNFTCSKSVQVFFSFFRAQTAQTVLKTWHGGFSSHEISLYRKVRKGSSFQHTRLVLPSRTYPLPTLMAPYRLFPSEYSNIPPYIYIIYIYIYIHILQLNIGVASFTSSIANLR